jgi:hypothetical protein
MIDGNQYLQKIKDYFLFLIVEYNYIVIGEEVNGNFYYDVQYSDKIKIVSISYENVEDYFQVIIFILQNGRLPDYDDKTKTLHLNKLNQVILSIIDKSEISLNNQYFSKFQPTNALEKKLLKAAKELRLCLDHFNECNV